MKSRLFIMFTLIAVLFVYTPIIFAEGCSGHSEAKTSDDADMKAPQVVQYKMPELTKEGAMELSKILAEDKGIIGAKPDFEKKTFKIYFFPEKTKLETIKDVVTKNAPKAEFEKVGVADPEQLKHDCSKCPHKTTCGHAAKS